MPREHCPIHGGSHFRCKGPQFWKGWAFEKDGEARTREIRMGCNDAVTPPKPNVTGGQLTCMLEVVLARFQHPRTRLESPSGSKSCLPRPTASCASGPGRTAPESGIPCNNRPVNQLAGCATFLQPSRNRRSCNFMSRYDVQRRFCKRSRKSRRQRQQDPSTLSAHMPNKTSNKQSFRQG